jgi:hypothetical protein
MKIFAYTTELRTLFSLKTYPEPWLHLGINDDGDIAVWVWDTRAIVETSKTKGIPIGKPVHDNHKPLKGQGAEKFVFSSGQPSKRKGAMSHVERQVRSNERTGKQMAKFMGRSNRR